MNCLRGGHSSVLVLGVLGVVVLLLVASCVTPTPYQPDVSTALRPTIEQGAVDLYLAGVKAEETLQAVRALETSTAVAGRATATAQAQAIVATRAAWEAEATRAAWGATATAASHQATATAQAQAAAATATRAAWEAEATRTAVAVVAIATAQAAQAEKARLEAERARLTYPIRAYGPWALLFTAFVLLIWVGYRMARAAEARLRAIPRDSRGDAPILIRPMPRGREAIVDPDRSLGPALVVDAEGVHQPQLAPLEYQSQVTARDQAVDLVSRGLPGQARRRRLPPLIALPSRPPMIRIVPPEQVRPWLEEVEPKILGQEKSDE
ncbi:MAG: hypothetical protein ACP5N6_15165 [Anaerolineae bacterium]